MPLTYYYKSQISDFLNSDPDNILGQLAASHNFALEPLQREAWLFQIANLKQQLQAMRYGEIFFEFSVPRMGKRADVIILIENGVFVIEYKVGSRGYDRYAQDQVLDYALDLKNFHEGSHNRIIIPILVATKAPKTKNEIHWHDDNVASPVLCNDSNLLEIINQLNELLSTSTQVETALVNEDTCWEDSGYKPTPTIIEAAQALYQGHSVKEISRSDAGAENLTVTSDSISEIIKHSKANNRKSICFVTGVPGAGKTLAGLNISTKRLSSDLDEHAVFLSGNGPLVDVLREALARDEVANSKKLGTPINKKDALRKVGSFIQNIHHFRDSGLSSTAAPNEHVVIFDEAQRAWDQAQAIKFMVKKRGVLDFKMSEPEFLISLMDRRRDWATIICLIGGGQEINTGEAGLVEWFNALQNSFKHWDIYHSAQLSDKNYNLGEDLESKIKLLNSHERKELHLSVAIRSFRAEKLSDFVAAVIDGDKIKAKAIQKDLGHYYMAVTRDLNTAKKWIRSHARGSERFGMVASSGAHRLKPDGIHVRSKIDPANWFLNGKEDIRSSYYLEDVATEFDIQGLELDWTMLCWDADFRMKDGQWTFNDFKGSKWQVIGSSFRKLYLANAYRVLLTRARQGMVIFVPTGDPLDHTRPPKFYDETYEFLRECGVGSLEA